MKISGEAREILLKSFRVEGVPLETAARITLAIKPRRNGFEALGQGDKDVLIRVIRRDQASWTEIARRADVSLAFEEAKPPREQSYVAAPHWRYRSEIARRNAALLGDVLATLGEATP